MGVIFDVGLISKSLEALINSIEWPALDDTPVFLNKTLPLRSKRISEVGRALEKLEDTLSSLSPLVKMVLDLQNQLQLRRARLQMSLNPISALPEDILVIIFTWATPLPTTEKP
ncbi:hypothetical protein DL93DRAFT_1420934 [Clavulina sp. PMI_390]|nr:hypothetical protein DL93DRAFT_1420934 [Clavulina sp. PMI_390]